MLGLGIPEFIVVGLVIYVPLYFYIRTLSKAIANCSSESRTVRPGQAWLMLIPAFNLVFHFIVVIGVAESLHNEFLKSRD